MSKIVIDEEMLEIAMQFSQLSEQLTDAVASIQKTGMPLIGSDIAAGACSDSDDVAYDGKAKEYTNEALQSIVNHMSSLSSFYMMCSGYIWSAWNDMAALDKDLANRMTIKYMFENKEQFEGKEGVEFPEGAELPEDFLGEEYRGLIPTDGEA